MFKPLTELENNAWELSSVIVEDPCDGQDVLSGTSITTLSKD